MFTPAGITTGSCEVKQLSLIAFKNPSGKSAFPRNELQLRSNSDKPYEWCFSREVPDRSNGDDALEMREHLRSCTPSLIPLVAARLLVFKVKVNMLAGEWKYGNLK